MAYSTILPKHRSCFICGKPSGGWVKCMMCRGKEYNQRSRERREKIVMNEGDMQLDKFYKFIYDKYEGFCQETGRKLSFNKKCVMHLLPKSKYPYFRLDIRNGYLVAWDIHSIVDKGSEKQRKALKIWKYISDTREKLLSEVGLDYSESHWLNVVY